MDEEFTKTLKKSMEDYKVVEKEFYDLRDKLRDERNFVDRVVAYTNKLFVSIGRLSPRHVEVCKVKTGGYYESIILATSNGLRERYSYGTIGHNLSTPLVMHTIMSNDVVDWISKNRKDKLSMFNDITAAFKDGFKKSYLADGHKDEDDDRIEIDVEASVNVIKAREPVISKFNVSKMVLSYSIPSQSINIKFYDKLKHHSVDFDLEWADNIELRDLFPKMRELMKMASEKIDIDLKGRREWFDNYQNKTAKYACISEI